jgi:hypothetical protein
MKTYKVSGLYRWSWLGAKVILTAVAGLLYFLAVTQAAPFGLRLLLLAGIALFGWLFYVRLPSTPTQITISDDGQVNFKSRRGTTSVQAADIRTIDQTFGRRALRITHSGGKVRVPNRFRKLVDLLLTLKGHNPALVIRGF